MLRRSVSVLFLVGLAVLSNPARAAVPELIPYQGVLTDARGAVVPDGTQSLTFRLYETATGGSAVWQETQSVTTARGIFVTSLGSVTSLSNLPFDRPYWLATVIAGRELTPRMALGASPYALGVRGGGSGGIAGVSAGDGLTGGGSSGVPSLAVGEGEGINITSDAVALDVAFTDGRYVNVGESNAVTEAMIAPGAVGTTQLQPNVVSSLNGVSNDGGNISLVAGPNVSITADDVSNAITISAVGGSGGSGDITGIYAGGGLFGGTTAGDAAIEVGGGEGIVVTDDALHFDTAWGDARYVSELETSSIARGMILSGAVGTTEIEDQSVVEADLATGAVTSVIVADGSLTPADFAVRPVFSLNGVEPAEGQINLVASGGISIVADNASHSVLLSASTGSGDVSGLDAGLGLTGGGADGDLTLNVGAGDGILVTPDDIQVDVVWGDARYLPRGENQSIAGNMVVPNTLNYTHLSTPILTGLNGVTNDGSDIELFAGANIQITNDDGLNRITVAAPNMGDITSVGIGSGLSGGGTTGDVSIGVATGGITGAHVANGSLTGADLPSELTIGGYSAGNGLIMMLDGAGIARVQAGLMSVPHVYLRDAANNDVCGLWIDTEGHGNIFAEIKNFVVRSPSDPTKEIWYASVEGPEAAAYVRGTAQLVNGEANVVFPQHFIDVATLSGMTVQVTPLSADSKGLAVVEKRLDGFRLRELSGGSGSYQVDWEVKAIRRGHESFEPVRPARTAGGN